MECKKIVVVFGTRPEAIKMAPVIKELKKHPEQFEVTIISTAQHREMLDQVLKLFKITPDYDLNIMKPKQTLSYVTSRALTGLEAVYQIEQPDMVLVHGDTTTSYAAALAAFYLKIPIGHVEAGLRTYDKYFPYPEEMNRQMIDNLADVYFVPTETAKENLLAENKDSSKIIVTGNTVIDAVHFTKTLRGSHSILNQMNNKKRWILLTMHRRENYGQSMRNVFCAIKKIVDEYDDVEVVIPVHLNPEVQKSVKSILGDTDKIHLIEPLEVHIFHQVMGRAYLILTDSGGLQEEGPALNKPVLVLREVTERPEGEKAGTLRVIGTDSEKVYSNIKELLDNEAQYQNMAEAKNPFGDGTASKKISAALLDFFTQRMR